MSPLLVYLYYLHSKTYISRHTENKAKDYDRRFFNLEELLHLQLRMEEEHNHIYFSGIWKYK